MLNVVGELVFTISKLICEGGFSDFLSTCMVPNLEHAVGETVCEQQLVVL